MRQSVRSVVALVVGAALVAGAVAMLSGAGDVANWTRPLWELNTLRVLVEALLVAALAIVIVRRSISGPVKRTAEWMRRFRTGDIADAVRLPTSRVFEPLVEEVMHLARSITVAKAAAEEEARLREAAQSIWTPDRL
jgi:trehalose 6-phosphate synthase